MNFKMNFNIGEVFLSEAINSITVEAEYEEVQQLHFTIINCVLRHSGCDYGTIMNDDHDKRMNDSNIENGKVLGRVLSRYETQWGVLYVVTRPDFSELGDYVTTVLFEKEW